MSVPPEIFKAYDIRGIVGKTLTPEIVTAIGQAIGSETRARGRDTLVIGRDGRLSGPTLSAALADGLTASGCDVIDIGPAPTPVVYFATHHLGTGSGVVVTGSHNPPDYNGLKIMVAGDTLSGDAIQDLKIRIDEGRLDSGRGAVCRQDIATAYLDAIVADVAPARRLRIVIDCGNGIAGNLAPRLYRRLGCEVHELFCEVDGRFPNHHPDPTRPENLADLIRTVTETGADFGMAFDGDGDRLGVVAPNGAIVWADRLMVLFARSVLANQPGAQVIYDVKCSQVLPRAVAAAGGAPLLWKTGHSLIKAKLKETGAALAGEMSGHIFFNDRWQGFDDGLYAGARLIDLLSRDSRSAAEVFAGLPDTVNTPELHLAMDEGEHFTLVRALIANAEFADAETSTIDGLRVDFPYGFGLVRPSNTTPTVILRFEADTDQNLARIQGRFRELIERTRPGLVLPF